MDRDNSASDVVLDENRETQVRRFEPHNLLALSAFSVLLRFAWIFKSESMIIPTFMDSIAGAGWLRGCLPVLNRFGQSLPPIFFAHHLRAVRVKKWSLLGTSTDLETLAFIPRASKVCYLDFLSARNFGRRGVAAVVVLGARCGGLFRAPAAFAVASQVQGLGQLEQRLGELRQRHLGEDRPMFGFDRHQHAFVSVSQFVGQRVAGKFFHRLVAVSRTQRAHQH